MFQFQWLLTKRTKYISANVPVALYHALETVVHIHNSNCDEDDEEWTRDHVITIALAQYMQKNLYTNSIDDVKVVTQINRKEKSFKNG